MFSEWSKTSVFQILSSITIKSIKSQVEEKHDFGPIVVSTWARVAEQLSILSRLQ